MINVTKQWSCYDLEIICNHGRRGWYMVFLWLYCYLILFWDIDLFLFHLTFSFVFFHERFEGVPDPSKVWRWRINRLNNTDDWSDERGAHCIRPWFLSYFRCSKKLQTKQNKPLQDTGRLNNTSWSRDSF